MPPSLGRRVPVPLGLPALVAGLALALLGCGGAGAPSSTAPSPAATQVPQAAATEAGPSGAAMDEAKAIFATRCTPCHGGEGKGDGAASAGLNPKPRNFTDPAWQSSVTDEHVEKIVKFGGAAVGKSPAMPNNPDLVAKPLVVTALRLHVRSLK